MIALLVASSCKNESEPEVEIDGRTKDFAAMKEKWTLALQTLVKQELGKITDEKHPPENLNTKTFEVFLEVVASDATFFYTGEDGMIMSPSLRLLKFIKKLKLLPEARFEDPFEAKDRFKAEPNEPVHRIHVSHSIFKNQKTYQDFCEWFNDSIKLAEPAPLE